MPFFVYRLISPRPTFPVDITDSEKNLMQAHGAYWRGLMENEGSVIVLGPVADPRGVYGLGILEVSDQAEAERLIAGDPALKANAGFSSECHPMVTALVRR